MVRSLKICAALGLGFAAFVGTAEKPASAITLDLAKKCRALALKTHPYKLPGEKGPGSAAAERDFYSECVAKGGNMSDQNSNGGQSTSDQGPTSPPEKQ